VANVAKTAWFVGALAAGWVAVYGCVGDDPVASSPSPEAGASTSSSSGGGPCEDATYCDDKCGASLKDKCGVDRDCSTPCGDGRKCDGLRCVCASSPTWCNGRCGDTTDNCGKSLPCGGCEAGPCDPVTHTCGGCVPEDKPVTCAGKACGFAKNNCGQDVDCGICTGNAACKDNVCCEPASVTCNGKCGPQKNNCGQTVSCPACCPNGKALNHPSNCGACNRNCERVGGGLVCAGGTCACATHENNSDPANCGPCTTPTGFTLDCTARGFNSCKGGACQ
jgi:hypothetical protein